MNKKKYYLIRNAILAALVIGFAVVFPQLSSKYYMTVMVSALIYAIAVLGMTLMLGMGGMMSLATISFMGIGAFLTANFSKKLAIAPWLSIPLAVAGTALVALLLGLIVVRLRSSYFTFATIGFVQIVNCILLNFVPLSGGPDGTSGIPKLVLFGYTFKSATSWFYLLFAIVVVCTLLVNRIRSSSLGRSLASIRDNEIAAQSLGVNIFRTRLIAFVLSAMLGGLSGALLAHQSGYISSYLFTYNQSITFLIMTMLGGVASPAGTVVGAVLVTMLPEWLRVMQRYLRLIYGASVVILMIFMPMGLAGLFESLEEKVLRKIDALRKAKKAEEGER